jgi:hypothetical protein
MRLPEDQDSTARVDALLFPEVRRKYEKSNQSADRYEFGVNHALV